MRRATAAGAVNAPVMARNWLGALVTRFGAGFGACLLALTAFWVLLLILLPQLTMVDFSFRPNLPPAEQGGARDMYTLEHYAYLIRGSEAGGFNTIDLAVFARTLLVAALVAALDLAICYPIAYLLAQSAHGGWARLLVLSLVVPFWVNEILRAFAFRILFGGSGVINDALAFLGLADAPVDFIRANVALYSGLAYAFVLLMIFPLYNAIESLDRNQVEAARDMGASTLYTHWRVVIPHAKPGISSGCTMVFMLSAGALAAPQILGGPSSLWFTQIIYQWFNTGNNWPRGSAYAIVLLVSTVLLVLLAMRVGKVRLTELGR